MRGLAKDRPPANVSPDGQTPRSFAEAEQEYLAALPGRDNEVSFARSQYGRLEKRRLRQVMYGEQRSLCVYCERRIAEGDPTPRIDHWRPLSSDPDFAIHWENLYLSCPEPETCDSAKGDRPFRWEEDDADMPWPVDLPYEDFVGFTSGGEIYVRSDVSLPDATRRALELAIADRTDGPGVRRGILNLNHPELVAARAAAVDSERTRLGRRPGNEPATRDEREQLATQILEVDQLPEYVSIRVAWLRKRLGRGR